MKRLLPTVAIAATGTMALLALAFVPSASADSAYHIPIFGCADGAPDFNLVPADTPLFVQSGWVSGTKGLVQSAIQNTTSTMADQRGGATIVYYPVWGPIEPFAGGGWVAHWRVDLPSLALGDSATVTMTQSFAHPQVDLGLPTKGRRAAWAPLLQSRSRGGYVAGWRAKSDGLHDHGDLNPSPVGGGLVAPSISAISTAAL